MDAIGSSTKLMWFFVFIYSFPILLLILSVAIWSYKKFKRFAFISYIADTTLTVLILLGDISNLVSRFIKGTPMYHLNLWNLFFLILSVIFIIISIKLNSFLDIPACFFVISFVIFQKPEKV